MFLDMARAGCKPCLWRSARAVVEGAGPTGSWRRVTIFQHLRSFAAFLVGASVAVAAALVVIGQFGRDDQMLDQFNSFLAVLLPILALGMGAAIRTRDRAAVLLAIVGLALGGWRLGQPALAGLVEPKREGPAVRVLTFSTYHSNPRPEAIRTMIARHRPDIAVLQETNGTAAQVVEGLLPRYHRIPSCRWSRCGLTILSRWPARRIGIGTKQDRHLEVAATEIVAPFGTFRVVNVHTPRPYMPDAPHALAQLAELAAESRGHPLIVAGDFNTATGSFGLARFARASGLRQMEGFVPTYPAHKPVPAIAGIDHIFAGAGWSRGPCRRVGPAHSDHFGVACTLHWTGAATPAIADRATVR